MLDTHIAFWLAQRPNLLTSSERDVLLSTRHQLFVSAVSIWELRLKWQSLDRGGQRKGPTDPTEALAAFRAYGLDLVPLDPEHASAPLRHPLIHKDPFDELLIVQAQELGMFLFTRDASLAGHPQVYADPVAPSR